MSSLKILAGTRTIEVPGGYELTLEADDGQIFSVFATENQINDLAEDLLDFLDEDEVEFTPEQEVASQETSS